MCPLPRIRRHTGVGKYFCPICNEPVKLDGAKCDEDGRAVHEDCYVKKVSGLVPANGKRSPTTDG